MREFDIYLDDRATKQFDVYLKDRLTQCDIFVYNLSFRDGISVTNRLILEACLDYYILQKLIAVNAGSTLVAHIDEMIKTVREMISVGQEINSSALFSAEKAIRINNKTEIVIPSFEMLETVTNEAEGSLLLFPSVLDIMSSKSLGSGESSMIMDSAVLGVVERVHEEIENGMPISAVIEQTKKQSFLNCVAGMEIEPAVIDLCYRLDMAGEAAICIAASILATEIHFSFGHAENEMVVDAAIDEDGAHLRKMAGAENAVYILTQLTETILQCFSFPEDGFSIAQQANAMTRRYRKLSDMDDSTLGSLDAQSLGDLYYVVLSE